MNLKMDKNADGSALTVFIEGSIDTVTAPALEEELNRQCEGVKELTLDFAKVDYVSCAGLRVIMGADQQMSESGKMILKNVNEDVREVFEMTGFDELLNIE